MEGPRKSESRTAVGSGHLLPGIHPKDMEPAFKEVLALMVTAAVITVGVGGGTDCG